MFLVRFFFDVAEVGSVFFLVLEADFVRNKFDGLAFEIGQQLFFVLQKESLLNVSQFADFFSALDGLRDFHHGEFAHTIHTDVSLGINQNAGFQAVRPVVVVRHAPQRGLDAADDDGHIGIELFQNVAIDHRGVIGTEACLAARSVSVVAAQAFVGRVVVHHRVHAARRHAKIDSRLAEFLEVAQVVPPVGLRNERHTETIVFQYSSNNRRPESRMIHIRIPSDEHDVHFVPTAQVGFFFRYGEPIE